MPESLACNFEALVLDRWFSGASLCSPFSNFRFDLPETGSVCDRDRLAEPRIGEGRGDTLHVLRPPKGFPLQRQTPAVLQESHGRGRAPRIGRTPRRPLVFLRHKAPPLVHDGSAKQGDYTALGQKTKPVLG